MARRRSVVKPTTIGARGTRVYFGGNRAGGATNRTGARVARATSTGQRTTRQVARAGVRITGQRRGADTTYKGRITARNTAVYKIGSVVGGTQKRFMAAGVGRAGYAATRRGAVALRQG